MRATGRPAPPFADTIRPLAIAPLAGLAVLGFDLVLTIGLQPIVAVALLLMIPPIYTTVAVFVLPLLWLVPQLRRPHIVVAALWGGAAAWMSSFVVVADPQDWLRWRTIFGFGCAGAASGVLYRYLMPLRPPDPQ
jgi:hypothetical protein